MRKFSASDTKFMHGLEAEVGRSARSEEGAMPLRIVTDERRRNRSKIGFPEGLGAYGLHLYEIFRTYFVSMLGKFRLDSAQNRLSKPYTNLVSGALSLACMSVLMLVYPLCSNEIKAEELTDDQLLEKVQRQTFRYFWDFAHPVSGMARERTLGGGPETDIPPIESKYLIPTGGNPGEKGLRAEYFSNMDMQGAPAIRRVDARVNMDWGDRGPGNPLPVDNFSVRWTGSLVPPESGEYELGIGSDDGSRLYLDGKLFVDNWGDHGYVVLRKKISLEGGRAYKLKMEFYEKGGGAAARLVWLRPGDKEKMKQKALDDPIQIDARENKENHVCATGGTGMGVMSVLVAAERKWITRPQAAEHILKLVNFLSNADRFHGVFSHWINGETGKAIPFTPKDDGGDIVETSYLMAGLLCAREYFKDKNPIEDQIRKKISKLWDEVEWNWYTQGGQSVLYWHWSPNHGWGMNHHIRGWNESLITYVLAASSKKHSIDARVYHEGWAKNGGIKNGRDFYGIRLPLGWDQGGPLFYAHYTFLGLNPKGLKDRYADYWQQNVNHTLINRAYCIANPKKYKGYGNNCWGLTASDNHRGYAAHSPTDDLGVISPTAALSSFPYTPEYSLQVLKHFYYDLGEKIWGRFGFVDAFSETHEWYASSYLAIDQGPIIVMIENYRTGLIWKLFINVPEVKKGLEKLEFQSAASK